MTCNDAREALLVVDPSEIVPQTDATLANHLRECAICADLANSLGGDLEVLQRSVRRRYVRRMTFVGVAAALPIAAGVVAMIVTHRAPSRPLDAHAPSTASVSVDVPPGQQATVFKTSDPKVTIVWMTSESGL
jgi:hypothetical protein